MKRRPACRPCKELPVPAGGMAEVHVSEYTRAIRVPLGESRFPVGLGMACGDSDESETTGKQSELQQEAGTTSRLPCWESFF